MALEFLTNTFTSGSVERTKELGALLAGCVQPGAVIALDGGLGAGKTHFTQGFAAGLGVADSVTSPTFTVMVAYAGEIGSARMPLYHFDLYRLEDVTELEDIGFYDYVEADGVSCIEWASKFADELPESTLWLSLDALEDGTRSLTATAKNEQAANLLSAWVQAVVGASEEGAQ